MQGGTMSIATITLSQAHPQCPCYVTDNGIRVCIIPLFTAQLAESERMRKEDGMRFQKSYEVCTCVAWATFVACHCVYSFMLITDFLFSLKQLRYSLFLLSHSFPPFLPFHLPPLPPSFLPSLLPSLNPSLPVSKCHWTFKRHVRGHLLWTNN